MRKADRERIKKWAESLSDEKLEEEYYKSVYDCLGSQTEEMYERGYDISDIVEREKFEKELCETSDIIESVCAERGIKLWESEEKEDGVE